ncbi:hypothetical protein SAMN05428949_1871 [Chitinophaga sp. YR627]|uniref:hypothetical protein n=1 Tax=Chitinophaga sp. YR627 TaxID=1881041 RepID=UPI0008E5A87A|nr:hypothetical protein [Chitinophaga sp. YR627]SFN19636.1 hypothetical protein SAMN05428949_1871 [Chitinophaga sp. YR627]
MRKLLLLICCIISYTVAYGQIAFYDAVTLRGLIDDSSHFVNDAPSKDKIATILSKYLNKDITVVAGFKNAEKNPFIASFFDENFTLSENPGDIGKDRTIASTIGGLDVTGFANAIASLMIDRAKQELTVAFFNRFKKFAKEHPEFQVLFPKTTDNLSNLLAYAYPQMLPALRKGFFEDLNQITYHLDDVMELPKYSALLKDFPEVRIAIRSVKLVRGLETGAYQPAELITKFASLAEWDEGGSNTFKNTGSAIKLAAVFSESFRNQNTDSIWVSAKQVEVYASDVSFLKLYLGLIYQKVVEKDIKLYRNDGSSTSVAKIIADRSDNIFLFESKLSEFTALADKVVASYLDIKKKKDYSIKLTNDDIHTYISTAVDISDYAFSIAKLIDDKLETDGYSNIIHRTNDLYKDIYSAQYTQAVNDAVDVLKELHDLTKKNSNAGSPADNKKKSLDELFTFIEKVKPYGLFMANIVESNDEEGIKAALDNVILPVGSSSIKKHSLSNFSIQTYLGAYYSFSHEKADLNQGAWHDKFGVTAPIGISYTPGFLSWEKYGAISLFASLIDLGAIVDYKLKQDSIPNNAGGNTAAIKKEYEIKLGQIFSPGFHLVYGFGGNLPLALGIGGQYGPGLSKITAENSTIVTNPSWRWNAWLTVDLPFFTIWNKPKRQ